MKKLKTISVLSYLCLAILLTSCPGKNDPVNPDCEKKWAVSTGRKNLANIKDGNLNITCSSSDTAVALGEFSGKTGKTNLTGNFEININFENYKPGIYDGSAFEVLLNINGNSGAAVILSKNILAAITLNKNDFFNQQTIIDSTDAIKPGNIKLKREGNKLMLSVTAGSQSYILTDDIFGDQDVLFSFLLACYGNGKTDDTSIQIKDITVTGGGGSVTSDTFDCNSIQ